VIVNERTIESVPLLLVAPAERGPLPTVFWFHGFNVDKSVNRTEFERLAAAGFLAVGVDAVGHGARRWPNLDEIAAAPREETLTAMRAMANDTAHELPALIDALVREGLADPERIAIVGVSMGGYVVYRALAVEPRIRAAVALLGSPDGVPAMQETALLSITAERDVNVPPDAARALHERLGWRDAKSVELAGAEHLMDAEQWERAMDEMLRWVTTYAARAGDPAPQTAAR
jgi:dienelactone hydrolase